MDIKDQLIKIRFDLARAKCRSEVIFALCNIIFMFVVGDPRLLLHSAMSEVGFFRVLDLILFAAIITVCSFWACFALKAFKRHERSIKDILDDI